MLETLKVTNWSGLFDVTLRARAAAQLEAGSVLLFPGLGFALDEAKQAVLEPVRDSVCEA